MIRIRTQIGKDHVLTMWFAGKWVSIYTMNGKTESTDTPTLFEAGQMHLQLCQSVKRNQEEKDENAHLSES